MKKIALIILVFLIFGINNDIHSQTGPPDPPPDHGLNGNQDGGGEAPIGGGILILLGLAGTYGTYRVYQKKKKSLLD